MRTAIAPSSIAAVRAFARSGSPADDLTLLIVGRPLSAVPGSAPSTMD
jgi:hypothetical protein